MLIYTCFMYSLIETTQVQMHCHCCPHNKGLTINYGLVLSQRSRVQYKATNSIVVEHATLIQCIFQLWLFFFVSNVLVTGAISMNFWNFKFSFRTFANEISFLLMYHSNDKILFNWLFDAFQNYVYESKVRAANTINKTRV